MAWRKRDERISVNLDVAYEEPGQQVFFSAVNLSRSGIFLASSHRPELGERVRTVLSLPASGRFLRMRGVVVRHAAAAEPDGFAVAFRELDGTTREDLQIYLDDAARAPRREV